MTRALATALALITFNACGDDDDGGSAVDAGSDRDGGDDDGGSSADAGGGSAPCAADNGGIALPDGFCAAVVARGIGRARHMTVTPSGDLFVAIAPSPDGSTPGRIVALRDGDGDGDAEMQDTFGEPGGNGIAWRDGQLYLAANDRVLRFALPDGELAPAGEPELIVSGLATGADHPVKTVVLVGESDLLLNIGSATNSCQQMNRAVESPGIDPCPELDERAGLFRFDATLVGQTPADGARFAAGVRNANALTSDPDSGAIVGVINGRDELAQDWPELYTAEDDLVLPSEELAVFEEGQDWGWPYCYHDPLLDQKVLAPEYGGDGETIGRCEAVEEPALELPAHWAPLAIAIYTGEAFPDRYRGGAFIAFHGSRYAADPEGQTPGYNVLFVPMEGGTPAGTYEVFADDFAGPGRPLPDMAEYRPVGVAEAPDGSLYVSSDVAGTVWRIFYTGE
jgi:glucose/arabinose dehydrogenase